MEARKYLEDMFKRLAKDDPFEGISVKGFLHLMQNHEMEIVGIVTNYAAGEKVKNEVATEACYNVMIGYFLDDFKSLDLFMVADALGRDEENIVCKSKELQFIYAVLWSTFMQSVREAARETMKEIRAEVIKTVS
jgi:hypothetical protein